MSLAWRHTFIVLGLFLGLLTTIRLMHERRTPAVVFSWLFFIVLVPYLGLPLYWVFGGRRLKKLAQHATSATSSVRSTPSPEFPSLPAARPGNQITILGTPSTAWDAVLRVIGEAKSSLYVETFILGKDPVGRHIVEELARRARDGVEVRVLVDALGSFRSKGAFLDPVRSAGGHVAAFLPLLPSRHQWSLNLRNHRKLIVADSKTAIVGGMNLAEEYMGANDGVHHWIDVGCLIEGPAANDITRVFAGDWEFATEEQIATAAMPPAKGEGIVELISGGPTRPYDELHDALLVALARAHSHIRIVTPYFVPDDALKSILAYQPRRGCKVDLIVPARSNHRIADLAGARYLRDLAARGVNVMFHPTRMIHAKILTVDDSLAVLGSANLDLRSLLLNFELCAFITSSRDVQNAIHWIDTLKHSCVPASTKRISPGRRLAENLAFFASPLL